MRTWVLSGFALGAAAPVTYGVYIVTRDVIDQFLRPTAPGCGSAMCLAYSLVFIAGPCCGAIGASVAIAAYKIDRWLDRNRGDSQPA